MRVLVFVLMAGVWIAFGDSVPLGTWVTSRTGPGTASVSVLATDHIYITVGNVQSGPNSTWGYATSETNLLTITPNTTYMLSSVCSVSGPGSGTMALLADGTSVASVLLVSAATSNRWISFTTGESGDSRVGQGLKVQMVAGSGFPGGGANADFASIKVATFGARPSLTLRRLSSTQLQLSWPVVFDGFIPEHASTPDGGVWQTVTNSVTTQGNENAVTIDTSGASRYFRLHKP